jgi:hypothetical protein
MVRLKSSVFSNHKAQFSMMVVTDTTAAKASHNEHLLAFGKNE